MQLIQKIILNITENKNNLKELIAIIFYKLNLLPEKFKKKVKSIIQIKKYNKIFLNLKLKYNSLGYHYLDPMPSKEFLNKYYKEAYWQSRWIDKTFPVKSRDIEHYKLIKNIYPDFEDKSKKILNFGAGPGGISILFHFANHEIYNFDPGGVVNHFSKRWFLIKNLQDIKFKFDVIYGSHSLEHVQNISETMKIFEKISYENTIFFFEVPNCFKKEKQKIRTPHTYYFTRSFFYNAFEKSDFCETFNDLDKSNDDEGLVIRFLTKNKIKNIF